MRIGVNTRFLLPHKMEGFGWYTYEVVKRLVEKHPEHEFVFFFDRPFEDKFIFGKNVTPVILSPQARHPFLFIIWFEVAIKKALKKYKCDIFFSPDGYLSLSSSIPQVCTIHDLNFEHNPQDLPWIDRKYYTKMFPRFAKKAKHILTVSQYSKNDIASSYKIDPSKITVAWNGASEKFRVLTEDEKSACKKKYSKGNDYFIFVGALHPRKNVQRLIQAYVKFKNETDSHIKLLIVGESLWKRQGYELNIDEKIKNEILFTGHLSIDELTLVMGSAYALTYVPYFEGFGIPMVEAMKCAVPIVSGNLTSLPEIAGNAAIYCDPFSVEDIAQKLISISSDQHLYSDLKEKAIKRSDLFSWDKTADIVWEVLSSK